MGAPAVSVIYFAIAAFVGALGQYLYKVGSDKASGSLFSYVCNWQMIADLLVTFQALLQRIRYFHKPIVAT